MKHIYQIIIGIFVLSLFNNCSKDAASNGLSNSNGTGGSTARFTISGNHLYVVDNMTLKAFNISNPQSPSFKSQTNVGLNIETIFPYNDKLFIGSSSSMYIYSLADPDHPTQVAKADYIIRMACDPVVAKDNVAYATLRSTSSCGGGFGQSALVVYNISNIAQPSLETTVNLNSPYGLGMKDNALYVCEAQGGLKVFNITNKFDPVQAGNINNETFYDVIPYGNTLIAQIAGGLALYDIGTNPLQPTFISKITE